MGYRALSGSLGILALAAVGLATCLSQKTPPPGQSPPQAPADLLAERAAVRQALHRYVGSTDLDAPIDVEVAQVGPTPARGRRR
jgi:hypothetical protein